MSELVNEIFDSIPSGPRDWTGHGIYIVHPGNYSHEHLSGELAEIAGLSKGVIIYSSDKHHPSEARIYFNEVEFMDDFDAILGERQWLPRASTMPKFKLEKGVNTIILDGVLPIAFPADQNQAFIPAEIHEDEDFEPFVKGKGFYDSVLEEMKRLEASGHEQIRAENSHIDIPLTEVPSFPEGLADFPEGLVAAFWSTVTPYQLQAFRKKIAENQVEWYKIWFDNSEAADILGKSGWMVRSWCINKRMLARKRAGTMRGKHPEWEIPLCSIMYYSVHKLLPRRYDTK